MPYEKLVKNSEIRSIAYLTTERPETVYAYVKYAEGVPHVICKKEAIPLSVFLKRYASGEQGLRLAATRRSDGRRTTISFSNPAQLTLGPDFLAAIADVKASILPASSGPESNAFTPTVSHAPTSQRQHRKLSLVDLEKRLARQREIGTQGEGIAFDYECARLSALKCKTPREHVKRHTNDDVGAGYDLQSDFNGETRYIEVKASTSRLDSFFISVNERDVLGDLGEDAFIYLVHIDTSGAGKSKVMQEIRNPLAVGKLNLEPVAFLATIVSSEANA